MNTLSIGPRTGIDCGACADACPVEAVLPVDGLFGAEAAHADCNCEYFAGDAARRVGAPSVPQSLPSGMAAPRVAAGGLVRHGVAPAR